jgi:amino acid permease
MFCASGLYGIIRLMKRKLIPAVAVFLLTAPPSVLAAVNIRTKEDLFRVLDRIATIIATIFWIAAAASVFYAGFLYLAAAGNSEKVGKAHRQLWYTVIAVIVGLFAYGLPRFLESILTP